VSYHLGPLLGFDLETTDRDPQEARIVTASILHQRDPAAEPTELNLLVNPGVEIPEETTAIHGVTTERARAEGMDAAHAVRLIGYYLSDWFMSGHPVVAFNASYDLTVVARELERYGLPPMANPWPVIDPHVIDKARDRYRPGKRTLAATAAHYGVELLEAHTASADARAALALARLMPEHEGDLMVEATRLHQWQVRWRAEQSKGLQDHLRKTDPDAVVEPGWPIQPRRV
jgi:DNA polymerase-3 subunit epsilon